MKNRYMQDKDGIIGRERETASPTRVNAHLVRLDLEPTCNLRFFEKLLYLALPPCQLHIQQNIVIYCMQDIFDNIRLAKHMKEPGQAHYVKAT